MKKNKKNIKEQALSIFSSEIYFDLLSQLPKNINLNKNELFFLGIYIELLKFMFKEENGIEYDVYFLNNRKVTLK